MLPPCMLPDPPYDINEYLHIFARSQAGCRQDKTFKQSAVPAIPRMAAGQQIQDYQLRGHIRRSLLFSICCRRIAAFTAPRKAFRHSPVRQGSIGLCVGSQLAQDTAACFRRRLAADKVCHCADSLEGSCNRTGMHMRPGTVLPVRAVHIIRDEPVYCPGNLR